MNVNTDALRPGHQFLVKTDVFNQGGWEFTFKKGAMAPTETLEAIEGKLPFLNHLRPFRGLFRPC